MVDKRIARYRVLCQHAIKFAPDTKMRVTHFGMDSGWYERFLRAIEEDDRDMKAISRAAGLGPNYVQQMVKDGKRPGVDRFMAILNTLGSASALYVLTGINMSEEDEEFFRVVGSLDPELKAEAHRFFRKLKETSKSS